MRSVPHPYLTDKEDERGEKEVAFADDLTAAGITSDFRKFWDKLLLSGPPFGYYPKAIKMWIIVKNESFDEAVKIFDGTNVQ